MGIIKEIWELVVEEWENKYSSLKKKLFMVIFLSWLSICTVAIFSTLVVCSVIILVQKISAMTTAIPTVIVGGWGGNAQQLEFLNKAIPNSIVMMEDTASAFIPKGDVSKKVKELEKKLVAQGIKKADFIGYSYGGLVVKEFASKHPEFVGKIVLIGTPNGGYKNWPFNEKSLIDRNIPIYLIGGTKSAEKWYLADENNDGWVDQSSLLSIPISGDARFFLLNHLELIQSIEVANQINDWLAGEEK